MSNRSIHLFFFITIWVIAVFSAVTPLTARATADSSSVVVRKADPHWADKYLAQEEFDYSEPPANDDFLSRLFEPLLDWLRKLGSFSANIPLPISLLLWVLIIVSAFLIIYKTKLYRIFYPDKTIESPEFQFSDNISDAVDYDSEIQKQVEQRQYRNAVRLLFLKLIAMLQAKGMIHYSKDRTNYDYLRELTDESQKSVFRSLIFIYSHVWYGNTEIDETRYMAFEKRFQSFYRSVDVQE